MCWVVDDTGITAHVPMNSDDWPFRFSSLRDLLQYCRVSALTSGVALNIMQQGRARGGGGRDEGRQAPRWEMLALNGRHIKSLPYYSGLLFFSRISMKKCNEARLMQTLRNRWADSHHIWESSWHPHPHSLYKVSPTGLAVSLSKKQEFDERVRGKKVMVSCLKLKTHHSWKDSNQSDHGIWLTKVLFTHLLGKARYTHFKHACLNSQLGTILQEVFKRTSV